MIQIVPCNDLIEHMDDSECPCGPTVLPEGIVLHAAMDRRECFEPDRQKLEGIEHVG